MAVKNYGWCLDTPKVGNEYKLWSMYPSYSRYTMTFPTKQDQLRAVVDAYRRGITKKQFELVNVRQVIDRDGVEDGDDRLHGIVKPSSSKKYGAIFVPDHWADGYEYDRYYVSDKGRLIAPQSRY